MDINEFVSYFAEQFEETDSTLFTPQTNFRNNDEWSSLTALTIIAMVDEKYSVKLTGDDLRKSVTIEDVFNIVNTKK